MFRTEKNATRRTRNLSKVLAVSILRDKYWPEWKLSNTRYQLLNSTWPVLPRFAGWQSGSAEAEIILRNIRLFGCSDDFLRQRKFASEIKDGVRIQLSVVDTNLMQVF